MRSAPTFSIHSKSQQKNSSDAMLRLRKPAQSHYDFSSKIRRADFSSTENGFDLTGVPTSRELRTMPGALYHAQDGESCSCSKCEQVASKNKIEGTYEEPADQAFPDPQVAGTDSETAPEPMDTKQQPKPPTPQKPQPSVTKPKVVVGNFRIIGSTADSGENNCAKCPRELGVHTTDFKNGMELRGDITGHVADAEYDFKRTREGGIWHKVKGAWVQKLYDKAGTDDDSTNSDESLTPVNNHIYSEDIPGLRSNPGGGDADVTEAVLKGNFIEWVNVKVGTGSFSKESNEFIWHSISWIEKVNGNWQRKNGKNEIDKGNTTIGTGNP